MSILNMLPAWAALQQTTTLPDTIITRTITERGWLETMVAVEQAIVGLFMLGMLVVLVLILVAIKKSVQELTKLIQLSFSDISGAAHSVRNVADDVSFMTRSLRKDVERIGDTITEVNGRVREAVEGAEERVRRFGELVDVVQDEAEQLVDSAASAVNGVKTGASVLRRGFALARWAAGNRQEESGAGEEEEDERPVRRRRPVRFRSRLKSRPRRG
ncbi:MAG: hypothetical protein U0163_01435 [Gemmatimonadaceae bacterium]